MHHAGMRAAGLALTMTTLTLLGACSSTPAPPAPPAPTSTPPPASSTEVKQWVHQFCAYTAPNAGYLPSLAAAGSVIGTPQSSDERAAELRSGSGTVRALQSTETALADQLAGLPGGAHDDQRALLGRVERDLASSLGESAARIDAIPTGRSAGFDAALSAAVHDASDRVRAASARIVADRGVGPAFTDDSSCRSLS